MRVLLAFDKFKDALSAHEACAVAHSALAEMHRDWELDACPLTDGGEGFAEILTNAAGGRLIQREVAGPRGEHVAASFGLVRHDAIPPAARSCLNLPSGIPADALIAVIEMAGASGLALLPPERRDVWRTTSFGTGQLIAVAAEAGAAAMLLGVGGSATNDLGLGALGALGLTLDMPERRAGRHVDPAPSGEAPSPGGGSTRDVRTESPFAPASWDDVTGISGAVRAHLPPIRIACDVSNPLLGPRGCAAVYGPQKGLAPADLPRLEHAGARMARLLADHAGCAEALMTIPGAGAAGGIAFGLMAAAGAELLPGFALVSAWLSLDARIAAADVILTGEGRFDESSWEGKGAGAIARRAEALGRVAHVFAGSVSHSLASGNRIHAISPPELDLKTALRRTPDLLRAAIRRQFGPA